MRKRFKNILLGLMVISAICGQPVLAADYDLDTYVYGHLENWDAEFKIDYYNKDVLDVIKEIAKKDDYLTISLSKLVYERKGSDATVKVTYKTTKEQEEYVTDELTKAVNSIIKENMTDYDKVKAINKYLVDRFEYDKSLTSTTAYSALTTGKTVCQGYALAAYKMIKMAGIENRIVVGTLDGVPHGWNLVKLNDKWYQLDVTNNDAVGSYKYFLKNDNTLKKDGFVWNASDYPAANENYDEAKSNLSLSNGNLAVVNSITKGVSSNQTSNVYKSKLDGYWYLTNNSWLFIKNTGSYATGWNMIDNNWYYFGSDGAMKTGWIYADGKWYYCYPASGAMAANTTINGYKLDFTGAWIA